MFGSGETLSGNASVFSKRLELYGATLGELWKPVVAAAAFSAMLSTVLTVVEAYPRSLAEALYLLAPRLKIRHHALWMVGTSLLGWLIVQAFLDDLTRLIDLVTSIACLSAPASCSSAASACSSSTAVISPVDRKARARAAGSVPRRMSRCRVMTKAWHWRIIRAVFIQQPWAISPARRHSRRTTRRGAETTWPQG